jgi:TM2 domain-containing membrane protein YozV
MVKSLFTLLTERKKNAPDKSPLLAAGLSAVIPGSGKIYGGQTIDGLFSFVSIALATWQAYDGFHDDGISSVKGWLVGSIAATFYVGNIYGSAVNIELQNQIQQTKFEQDVRALVKTSFRF